MRPAQLEHTADLLARLLTVAASSYLFLRLGMGLVSSLASGQPGGALLASIG